MHIKCKRGGILKGNESLFYKLVASVRLKIQPYVLHEQCSLHDQLLDIRLFQHIRDWYIPIYQSCGVPLLFCCAELSIKTAVICFPFDLFFFFYVCTEMHDVYTWTGIYMY